MGDEAAPVPVAAPRESSDADFEKVAGLPRACARVVTPGGQLTGSWRRS